MNLIQFNDAIELGLIYALISIGVFITFRVIDFPDLTVDGSLPLGGAVSAVMIVNGHDPVVSLVAAALAGGLAGVVTGLLNVKGGIIELLAGILTMTALSSINLRIMGQPNLALIDTATIFFDKNSLYINITIIVVLVAIVTYVLESEIGLAMRAIGVNQKCSKAQGINVGIMKVSGLALSNALVALGGAIFAQKNGFADVSMGSGTVIIGLASVIIGENILRTKAILWLVINCVLGSILYRLCITLAINSDFIGLEASDLNLITSFIVAVAMIVYNKRKNVLV
jgi:putative ABC transport system permease protein